MKSSNGGVSRLLPLAKVTGPKDIRDAIERTHPDPFEVDGTERVFRLHTAFQTENSNGAAGLVRQALLWAHARQMEFEHFQQFRQRVGSTNHLATLTSARTCSTRWPIGLRRFTPSSARSWLCGEIVLLSSRQRGRRAATCRCRSMSGTDDGDGNVGIPGH